MTSALYISRRMEKHIAYLCIGGNLGNREENLEETRMFVNYNMGDITRASAIYETEPWHMENVPAFLNQVLEISTELSPVQLMQEIMELEEFFGRIRTEGEVLSREMDVDILFYDDLVLQDGAPLIPHPRLQDRKFVLVPLEEIAPDLVHPLLKKNTSELLRLCNDLSAVKKLP